MSQALASHIVALCKFIHVPLFFSALLPSLAVVCLLQTGLEEAVYNVDVTDTSNAV